ncbi:MAG: Ribosome maturation factor RimP [Firmicutes bacterium ADurb.Bin182]|nr:MAG: Ribosome maturation factor RimP [Firmicutes bacterium ADurb.Bin182]
MKTVDKVNELVQEPIAQMGYELVETEFKKEQDRWVLTFYIDSSGGITLDDCERVSRAVEAILDKADPIEQSYYLSVSSLGLDRPIKTDRDFKRNLNKKVTVKLYAPIGGQKEFTGLLTDYDSEKFTLVSDSSGQFSILRKDAAIIKPYIEFK